MFTKTDFVQNWTSLVLFSAGNAKKTETLKFMPKKREGIFLKMHQNSHKNHFEAIFLKILTKF